MIIVIITATITHGQSQKVDLSFVPRLRVCSVHNPHPTAYVSPSFPPPLTHLSGGLIRTPLPTPPPHPPSIPYSICHQTPLSPFHHHIHNHAHFSFPLLSSLPPSSTPNTPLNARRLSFLSCPSLPPPSHRGFLLAPPSPRSLIR